MPAASVHTVNHEPTYARVRLNFSGFASGTTGLQVVRRDLDTGKSALVRGARRITIVTPASDAVQLYDYEFPAGHQVRYDYYQFPDTVAYQAASAAAYDVDSVWLKHLTQPYLSRPVRVGTFTPYEHQLRGAATPAVRRSVPIGGGDVRGGRRFALRLKLTADERDDLDNLLAVGGIWLYQKPSADVGLPRSGYVQPTRAVESTRGYAPDGGRWLDLTLDEVGAPDADLVAAATNWTAVTTTYATWTALGVAHASWNSVLSVVADPEEVTVT